MTPLDRYFLLFGQPDQLLDLNLGTSTFELSLDLFGIFLADRFLDRFRSSFNQILGFLQAQTGDGGFFCVLFRTAVIY